MAVELLTADELATWLRIRPRTVRDWSRRGRIPARRLSHKIVRYVASEVIEALSKGACKEAGRG